MEVSHAAASTQTRLPILAPGLTPIFGAAGNDTLAATDESQAIFGRAGNDLLSSLFNTTALVGGSGNDRLTATMLALAEDTATGTNLLEGGAGRDRLVATGGTSNILDGGSGNDIIVGSDGTDWIWGGTGRDGLTGGAGADHFIFAPHDDRVRERCNLIRVPGNEVARKPPDSQGRKAA